MPSHNQQLAQMFYEIADFLEAEGVPFKPQAYQKAAQALEGLEHDVKEVYSQGNKKAIKDIKGVGEHIADKIIEYLETGKIAYYQRYKNKYPLDIKELTSVEGIGPKMALELYNKLGVRNLNDLEKAAQQGKVRVLPGFGIKTEQNILQGINFVKKGRARFLLGDILPLALSLEEGIRGVEGVGQVSVCGSLRRQRPTIGDIDFLVTAKDPFKVMDFVCSLEDVVKVWSKGEAKASVRLRQGFDIDVRVVDEDCYGAALQYFTGNKAHNIHLRKIAQDRGFKLNEYGLFKGQRRVVCRREQDVYEKLGMACPVPELRRDQGEIEAALNNNLPALVEISDIKGDLHCHSDWDGGKHSIKEMAEKAIELGYDYLGISDHTKFLRIENGLDERNLAKQRKEIDELNSGFTLPTFCQGKKLGGFRILQGAETNILKDGSIDIKDSALANLDYAIAGIHSNMKMSEKEMTERIIKAMKNPYINIISHPTGRLLKKRDPYQVDMGKLFRAARMTKTALEINASPQRLDLRDEYIREAWQQGVALVINTDAHDKSWLEDMQYGVAQARRGWAEKKHILNTRSAKELLNSLR